jgi:hypothetical protein
MASRWVIRGGAGEEGDDAEVGEDGGDREGGREEEEVGSG